jgi:hypothetical protein
MKQTTSRARRKKEKESGLGGHLSGWGNRIRPIEKKKMREKKKKPESLGFLENWNKEPKQHETDVALQLDPFSSFGVRNPRLSAKEPTK